jgi:hypothetical protein
MGDIGKSSGPLATVTVDFASEKGTARSRASGFLHGISAAAPQDHMVWPLKPRLFRFDAKVALNVELYRRLSGYGAAVQVIMSHAFNYPSESEAWPGDGGDWTAWENLVERLVLDARSKGMHVLWDIWNEADDQTFWKRSQMQFFETWRRAAAKIRSLDPDVVIVGPSTGLGQYLNEFLLYARDKNVLPDVVSWHELWPGNLEHDHVGTVRRFMAANGIADRPVSINEFQQAAERHRPGFVVAWLSHLEEEHADSAAYACWDDPADYSDCSEATLDGLLTIDGKPRAGWFAHKGYADITGMLVKVSRFGSKIAGVAGVDPVRRSAQVLLGRREAPDATELEGIEVIFQNVDHAGYLAKNGEVFVRAERIPDSGTTYLSQTQVTVDQNYPVVDNTIRVSLPHFNAWDAYIIRLGDA